MTLFEIVLTASSLLSLAGGAFVVWHFRKTLKAMQARMVNTETRLLTRIIRTETELATHTAQVGLKAREHAEALASSMKADLTRVEDFLKTSVAGDYKEVLSLKADLLGEVKALHNRIQAAEHAATKGYETAKNGLVEAARSVMVAPRRVCGWCSRLVHDFELTADGSAKCKDCKAAGR